MLILFKRADVLAVRVDVDTIDDPDVLAYHEILAESKLDGLIIDGDIEPAPLPHLCSVAARAAGRATKYAVYVVVGAVTTVAVFGAGTAVQWLVRFW